MAKYLKALPPPPDEYDASGGFNDFRMFANDRYGDCTVAENGNAICGLTSASHPKPAFIPTERIVECYFRQTGGSDSGLNIADDLEYQNANGLVDEDGENHKPGPYGAVDATDLQDFAAAVYYFGRLKIGICSAGLNVADDEGFVNWPEGRHPGGLDHCVLVCGRRKVNGKFYYKLASWGNVYWVNEAFVVECCGKVGEAWATYNCSDRFRHTDGRTIEGFSEEDLIKDWELFNNRIPPTPNPVPEPPSPPSPPEPGPNPVCSDLIRRGMAVFCTALDLGPNDPKVKVALEWLEKYLVKG